MRTPHAGIILGFGAGVILLLCAPSLFTQTAEAKAMYGLLYSHIDRTEPVVLKLEIANLTDEDLELNLGWDQHDQIYFTATGPSGRMEIHEPPPSSFDPVGRFGKVALSPKGTYAQQIVLSQWASFDTPGDYTIELHLRSGLGLQTSDSLQVETKGVHLTVVANAAPFVQHHCVEEWNQLKRAHDGGEAMDAAIFLGNVKNPLAVPFMSAALDTEHATAIGGILITGLERIGNMSAVKALGRAMNGRGSPNAQFAREALARIARESSVPEVAEEARVALDTRANIPKP